MHTITNILKKLEDPMATSTQLIHFKIVVKMAKEFVSVHLFPPAVNTMVHDQCAVFKGTYEKKGADLRWEVLPTHAF